MVFAVEQVLMLYERYVSGGRGDYFLLDRGRLESALASPNASFSGYEKYPTVVDKTAVLIFKVGKAHAFSDGNKRLAWLLGMIYLDTLGYVLEVSQVEAFRMVNNLMCCHDLPGGFRCWLNDNLVAVRA